MTHEEEIEEILYEAAAVGLRESVLELAKKFIEDKKYKSKVDSYNQAFLELVENKVD